MRKLVTAEEAASLINNDENVGFSGFTAAGCAKVVPAALAKRAKAEQAAGRPFKIGMFTGASTSDGIDGELARANAIKFRTPYQSNTDLRNAINAQEVPYYDMHLSHLTPMLRHGFLGKIDTAIIEAAEVTDSGEIVPTCSVGIAPTACRLADKIIIELNRQHPKEIRGIHDIYIPKDQPEREAIPVYKPSDRAGLPYIKVDPAKIVAIVETDLPDESSKFTPIDEITAKIGDNVANFLVSEVIAGRIPKGFLPVQSGVGNVANAVLGAMGENKSIPRFELYSEVIQDSVIALMKADRVSFASGCSFTLSAPLLSEIYSNLEHFKPKLMLRSQEMSNNPEIIRRLGIIATNTALEADIFGNVNSTHVLGTRMMNGIGGSGDFIRNAYLSIFVTPSVAKGTSISAIVPMVSHVDHNEHSVEILITEQGVADLRGKSPIQRAHTIIENCVHPEYKQLLRDYLKLGKGHTPHNLRACFEFHNVFSDTKDMRNVDWSRFK